MPSAPHDTVQQKPSAYMQAARNDQLVAHFRGVLGSWCSDITKYIQNDPSSQPLESTNTEGPDVEIDYWSRRMLSLISITEQLMARPNR